MFIIPFLSKTFNTRPRFENCTLAERLLFWADFSKQKLRYGHANLN